MSRGIKIFLSIIILLALLGGGFFLISRDNTQGNSQRQSDVKQKGKKVMPFDQEKTQHIFTDLETGGRQKVIINDQGYSDQLPLIRSHLQEEKTKFSSGNLDDPAAIHGTSMPGLAELKKAIDENKVTVSYQEIPEGAILEYKTTDAEATKALHLWFKSQRSDHNAHTQ